MISSNTSSKWSSSLHSRIRRTSACRSRLRKNIPIEWSDFFGKHFSIIFLLRSRMMNILLPAYSRQFSALRGAGLVTAADEMENHELEHLVLRERGVVWADQEGAELQLKGEGIGVESQEINHAGNVGLCSELAPVLSFSHLLYHQSSPCSKSSHSLSSSALSFVSLLFFYSAHF